MKSAREAGGVSTEAPLVGDVVKESSEEEAEADDPSAMKKRCILRRASSGEPVRSGRAEPRQGGQRETACMTRAVTTKKKAAVAKKKATASSSSKCYQTPSPPPPHSANADTKVAFDFSSLSPRRKRKAVEEEVQDE